MSVSVAALFAAALFQVKAAEADPESMDEAVALLARAANNLPLSFESVDGQLFIDDIPLPADAPGVSLVLRALGDHHIRRLVLPAGLQPRNWRDVAEVLAAVPSLYATIDDLRDALRASVPAATVLSDQQEVGITDLREELFEMPGLLTDAGAISSTPTDGLTSPNANRAELSERLDPILRDASAAVDERDFDRLAGLLLELAELGQHANEATRTILARERRRVVPQSIVEAMVRLLPRPEQLPVISKVVAALGRDGVDALINAMSGTTSSFERQTYIDALTASSDADPAILASLGSAHAELVRDAAEVAGRRRMDLAVQPLGHLLKHNDERVRTAAWQALERIGTNEALGTLYGAGRNR